MSSLPWVPRAQLIPYRDGVCGYAGGLQPYSQVACVRCALGVRLELRWGLAGVDADLDAGFLILQPLQPLEVVSRYVSVEGPPSCLAGAERSQVPSRGSGAREGDGNGAASAALLCGIAQGAARGDLRRDLPGVARGGDFYCCTLIRFLLLSRLFCGSNLCVQLFVDGLWSRPLEVLCDVNSVPRF